MPGECSIPHGEPPRYIDCRLCLCNYRVLHLVVVALAIIVLQWPVATVRAGISLQGTVLSPLDAAAGEDTLFAFTANDESALTVSWELANVGWFTAWNIVLRSDTGLIPKPLFSPQTTHIQKGPVSPQAGHTYDTAVSYDSVTGSASVTVYDVTAGKMLFAEQWTLNPSETPLRPAAHLSPHVTRTDAYLPLAAGWDLVTLYEGDYYGLTTIIAQNRPTALRLRLPAALPGQWALTGGEVTVPLGRANIPEDDIILSLSDLPAGPVDLSLQYTTEDGMSWQSHSRRFTVGLLEDGAVRGTIAPDGTAFTVAIDMESDRHLQQLAPALHVTLYQLRWDDNDLAFTEHAVYETTGGWLEANPGAPTKGTITMNVPIAGDSMLWRVAASVQTDAPVHVNTDRHHFVFNKAGTDVVITRGNWQRIKASPLQPTHANWENDTMSLQRQFAAKPTTPQTVAFIGSSSIRGWTTLAQDFPFIDPMNVGFGGSHLIDSLYYADRLLVAKAPPFIALYAGTNDIAAGKSAWQVLADYVAFTRHIHDALPETHIGFLAIVPSPSRWNHRTRVDLANRLIQMVMAGDDRLSYIDVYSPLLTEDGEPRPELYGSDRLHMNRAGYLVWIDAVRPWLREHVPAK